MWNKEKKLYLQKRIVSFIDIYFINRANLFVDLFVDFPTEVLPSFFVNCE